MGLSDSLPVYRFPRKAVSWQNAPSNFPLILLSGKSGYTHSLIF